MNHLTKFLLAGLQVLPGIALANRIQLFEADLEAQPRLGEPMTLVLPDVSTCTAAPFEDLAVSVREDFEEGTQRFVVTIDNPNPMNTIQCDAFETAAMAVPLGPLGATTVDVSVVLTGKEATATGTLDDLEPLEAMQLSRTFESPAPSRIQPGNALEPARITVFGCGPRVGQSDDLLRFDLRCSEFEEPAIRPIAVKPDRFGTVQLNARLVDGSYLLTELVNERSVPPSVSGAWYDPDNPGHGFTLQLISSSELLAHWYVYDSEGNQLWLFGVLRNRFDDVQPTPEIPPTHFSGRIFRTGGNGFPPDFDPAAVSVEDIGNLGIEFSGCTTANAAWTFDNGIGLADGEIAITQLTATEGSACSE